jgi:hypothetical protein
MAKLIRGSGRRLTYTGRIPRSAFLAWTSTRDGHAAVSAAAARIRFSILGKERAARRRLWRQLSAAARDSALVAAARAEVESYIRRLSQLAYADGLPRVQVELHRLVVVPHALLNAAAYKGMSERLARHPALAGLDEGRALRDFLFLQVIQECDAAVLSARPSPKRPVDTGGGWVSVGVNRSFVWRELLNTPTWSGHHYVLELTRDPITRRVRKGVAEGIRTIEASLPALSVLERLEILRRASAVSWA